MSWRGNSLGKNSGAFLFVLCLLLGARTGGAAPDPFTQCAGQGVNETACLARLGEQFDWRPTEAACRFLSAKTEAIIEAGGDVRYRDLFYNERCARLGLPHGLTAAAGVAVDPDSLYRKCRSWETDIHPLECNEELGQHFSHSTEGGCHLSRISVDDDRKNKEPSTWYSLFGNERCWRLGLPHYETE